MSLLPENRIIDASFNRLAEGLRLLEDVARMALDDAAITQQLKNVRHRLVRRDLGFNLELLRARDSTGDVGAEMTVPGEKSTQDLPLIVIANARRAQESLRVLEEMAKLPDSPPRLNSEQFKQARFEIYDIEKGLISRLLRKGKTAKIKGLYVVIDTTALQGRRHVEAAEKVIAAGVKVIQLRDKNLSKPELIPVARQLQQICSAHGVLFVMNDYLDVALASGADGLHVGQEDLPVEYARRLLPIDKIIGCSVDTLEQARAAASAGADYIAAGSIFPTSSKEDIRVVGTERLREIKGQIKLPLVAIGGISLANIDEVMAAGADSAAVISAVLGAQDITRAARQMIERIEKAGKK
jgi:thiamine-phosphate pyrophosphorylase